MLFKSIFAAFALAGVAQYSDACSCRMPSEIPIDPGCPQKFISVVTVTAAQRSPRNFGMQTHFKYEIVGDITPQLANKSHLNKEQFISSASDSAACGVTLLPGTTYLMMGGLDGENHPHLVSCGSYIRRLEKVPTKEEAEKMMQELYQTRCVKH